VEGGKLAYQNMAYIRQPVMVVIIIMVWASSPDLRGRAYTTSYLDQCETEGRGWGCV